MSKRIFAVIPALAALCIIILAASRVGAAVAQGALPDDTAYAGLLFRHVSGGLVDYAGLKAEEPVLNGYLDSLEAVDPAALSPAARCAFYLNAYNAWTLKLVLEHYPGISSIRQAGPPFLPVWRVRIVRLKSGKSSLAHIEHDLLLGEFQDARLHMALNCASRSCPDLAPEPYAADRLDAQLDARSRRFVNDAARNRLEGDELRVSRIFDWYGEDFGGEEGVLAFFRRHADPVLAARLQELGERVNLSYFDYDWSLNGR